MIPCPSCTCHVVSGAHSCPHCGHVAPVRLPTAAMLLLSLTLGTVACTPEPKYGVSVTDTSTEDTADTAAEGT
ncbi:MAG: hypothetical protein ABMA64_16555 [Myxococcota bacterium]